MPTLPRAGGLPALVAVLAAGCGGGLAPVTGVVRLDGQPVEGAALSFSPIGPGRAAYATTAADGTFAVWTDGRTGVAPGSYRVMVLKRGANPKGPAAKGGPGPPAAGPALPAVYGSTDHSPLRCTIPDDGSLVLDLQSSAEPPAAAKPPAADPAATPYPAKGPKRKF